MNKNILAIFGFILLGSSIVFASETNCAATIVSGDFSTTQKFPQVLIEEQNGGKYIDLGKVGIIEIQFSKSETDLLLIGKGTLINSAGEFLGEDTFHQLVSPMPESKPVPRTAGLYFDLRSKGAGHIVLFCAEGNFN